MNIINQMTLPSQNPYSYFFLRRGGKRKIKQLEFKCCSRLKISKHQTRTVHKSSSSLFYYIPMEIKSQNQEINMVIRHAAINGRPF